MKVLMMKKSVDTLMTVLNEVNVHAQAIYEGYMGMAFMLKAKHAWNPYHKLKYFSIGKKLLESAANAQPNNIEIRYLRHTVQVNAPAFLGYRNNIYEDRLFLVENINDLTDSDLKQKILIFLYGRVLDYDCI